MVAIAMPGAMGWIWAVRLAAFAPRADIRTSGMKFFIVRQRMLKLEAIGLGAKAGFWGGVAGTAFIAAYALTGAANYRHPGALVYLLPFVLVFSIAVCIPMAVMTVLPIVWRLRGLIAHHPVAMILPVVMLGCILSYVLLGWSFRNSDGQMQDAWLLWLFSSTTSFAFVVILWRDRFRQG